MAEKNWMELMAGAALAPKLLAANEYTQKYGLTLSQEDAQYLVQKRRQTLAETRRVEFGQGILPALIYEFCDSALSARTAETSRC